MGDDEPVNDQGDEVPTIPGYRGGGTLRPFVAGDERTRAAGRRGVAVREARRVAARGDAEAVAHRLARLVDTHDRAQLGPQAAAVAADLIGRVAMGEIPVRHTGDAAEMIRVLVDVARLESGQATTQTVVAHLGTDAAARVLQLQQQARAVLGQGVPLDGGGVEG